tara:strand:+ start:485 stop:643 length:159 start_codon:yes stop_codon:yes gene_type:complete
MFKERKEKTALSGYKVELVLERGGSVIYPLNVPTFQQKTQTINTSFLLHIST